MEKRTSFENFLRGGDVQQHRDVMLLKNIGAAVGVTVVAAAAATVATAWVTSGKAWPLYWRYNLADVVVGLGLPSSMTRMVSIGGYSPLGYLDHASKLYNETFTFTTPLALFGGLLAGIAAARWIYKRFVARGETFGDKHIRGTQIRTQEELLALVNKAWSDAEERSKRESKPLPNKYHLAGIPLPPFKAQRNILVTGGMGSGKSVAVLNLADEVVAAKKTMVVYDKVGEFAKCYYREGKDVIFNPFDSRFPGWTLFNEISKVYDFDQLAAYLIPDGEKQSGAGDYFKDTARTVFSAILQKLWEEGRCTNEALCQALFQTSMEDLYIWLKGTRAENLLNPEKKSAADTFTTMTEAVKVLRYIPSGPFSLKDFVREAADVRLFVVSKEEVHPILQPLTSMVMNILYKTVMAQEEVPDDKYWFFLDEFSSLGKLPVFEVAVTEARKYGAVSVVGAQSILQFYKMFGQELGKVVMSNLQNQLILQVAEADTQEQYSKLIGSGEYEEQSEGISMGANSNRDGTSINTARKERRAVMASEIALLPDRTGYLKLAGNFDVARVTYDFKQRTHNAVGIAWRDDLTLKRPGSGSSSSGVSTEVLNAEAQGIETTNSDASATDVFSLLGELQSTGGEVGEPIATVSFEVDEDGVILNMPEEPGQADDAPPVEPPKRRKRLL